jgi:hypothetical protein
MRLSGLSYSIGSFLFYAPLHSTSPSLAGEVDFGWRFAEKPFGSVKVGQTIHCFSEADIDHQKRGVSMEKSGFKVSRKCTFVYISTNFGDERLILKILKRSPI